MTDPAPPAARDRPALARTVVVLGVVSFLTDVASDMAVPYLPLFLTGTLGAGTAWVGLVEGVAEATAAVVKYVSGRVSDRMHRKKPLVLLGYGVANLARPLLSVAMAPWHVLAVRFVDRIGKGIRTAPRDALIARETAPQHRGAAFGFHRGMDNFGAVFGPLAAMGVLAATHDDLRAVFAATVVPGMLALLAVVFFVREAPAPCAPAEAPAEAPAGASSKRAASVVESPLSPALRRFLVLLALFSLGGASDGFLLLQAHRMGVATRWLPLCWGALSALRAGAAIPGGRLADRWGHARTLTLGWWLYALCWGAFGFVTTPLAAAAVLVVYGCYYGLTEGTERAYVASLADERALGRAYGAYNLVAGLFALPASLLFGALWDLSPRLAFGAGAVCAGLAAAGMTGDTVTLLHSRSRR